MSDEATLAIIDHLVDTVAAIATKVRALDAREASASGRSAYEVWLSAGNSGSEADYLRSLRGTKGEDAPPVDTAALADEVLARLVVPEPPTAAEIAALVPRPPTVDEVAARVRVEPPPTAEAVAKFVKAEQGLRGPKGDTPAHEWVGSKLRFQKPDGEWGEFVELRGPKGTKGDSGVIVSTTNTGGAELPDVPDDYFSNIFNGVPQ